MAALKYWVWLASMPALTNRSKLLLLEHFTSPESIFYADEEAYWQVEGLHKTQAALLTDKSLERAGRILNDCARKELFVLTMDDATYPARLRNIYDPPVLLYGKGSMPLFDDEAAIAVVGTRKCTPYGINAAEQLGYEMAKSGAVVVSGLAKGIDAAAHRGALRAGGFTQPYWAAVWMWCTRRKIAGCMRISLPQACFCRSTRRQQSRRRGISR